MKLPRWGQASGPWPRAMLTAAWIALLAVTGAPPATAQTSVESTAQTTPEIEALIHVLEDPAQRGVLIEKLRAIADQESSPPPRTAGAKLLDAIAGGLAEARAAISDAATAARGAGKLVDWLRRQIADSASRAGLLDALLQLVLVLGVGLLAERLAAWLLLKPQGRLARVAPRRPWQRLPLAVGGGALAVLPVVAFAAGAYLTLTWLDPSREAGLIVLALVNGSLLARLAGLLVSAVLAPRSPRLRLLPIGDEIAASLHRRLRWIVNAAVYGYVGAEAALLLGLPRAGQVVLLDIVGLVVVALLAATVLRYRAGVAAWLGMPSPVPWLNELRRVTAGLWHVVALVYVAALYLIWVARVPGGVAYLLQATAVTLIAFVAATALTRLAGPVLSRVSRARALTEVAPSGEGRFVAALRVVAASVVYGAALLASLWAWRVPLESWLTTPIGLRLLGSALIIGLAALAATAIWEAIGVLIDRHLRRGPGSSAEKLRRRARIETLVPVLRKIVLWMLAAVVVIVVMSELGIDPAPLIAGAGVAGIAIGLGAQSLIKDLVTGISHILEDTFAVGDVVRVGDFSGVVEGISIRAVRLRDTDGAVHTIPFSAVAAVTNLTKEYAFAPLDVGVAYGEDLDRVMATIREVAAGLRADPAFAALLPEEAEILGVDAFQDSSVLVRGRLKTLPGQQWVVAREYRRRLKLAFDAKGIEIPYPQRTVHTRVEVVPPAASD